MKHVRNGLLCLLILAAATLSAQTRSQGKPGKEIRLFNGVDFCGWTYFLSDPNLKLADVWSINGDEGIIVCKGEPAGYLRTVADFTNFILKLEWRWSPASKRAGNSGVLLRMVGEDKIWPRSIEAQLQHGNAGDFWLVDGAKLNTDPKRVNPGADTNRLKIKNMEKPVGEWNEYEITADGGHIVLKINGQMVNEGTGAEVVPGKILLQSEGAEIHFRNIRLIPIKR